jgi:hypothetical protein
MGEGGFNNAATFRAGLRYPEPAWTLTMSPSGAGLPYMARRKGDRGDFLSFKD